MELRDYTIPRERVTLPGKVKPGEPKPFFEVRGLCADDLTFLIMNHHAPITKALMRYQEQRDAILKGNGLTDFILALARDFPDLVAEVISAATDSLDDLTRSKARKLPFPTQLDALNKIVTLSMEDMGDLKNLLAEMRDRIVSANGAKK
jgi:hypothetical protein